MLVNPHSDKRTRITQVELIAALASHERFVKRVGGMRAMFKLKDLSGMVLANRCLDDADFTAASLVGANAYGSSFLRASLHCADLRGCNLRYAKLTRADLRGACFAGAELSGAVLDYADMRVAVMAYADSEGELRKVQHDAPAGESATAGVDFRNASLKNVSFGNAKLVAPNFSGAILHGARFTGATFVDANFNDAVLTGVNLAELKVPPQALKSCILDPSPNAVSESKTLRDKIEAHTCWAETGGKDGKPAVLDGADLRPLNDFLKNRNLVGLSARDVVAIGVDFSGCLLQGAKFSNADLRGARFADCDLSGTSFKAAKLNHTQFDRARLGALPLQSGDALVTCLEETDAVSEQFNTAVITGKLSDFGLESAEA